MSAISKNRSSFKEKEEPTNHTYTMNKKIVALIVFTGIGAVFYYLLPSETYINQEWYDAQPKDNPCVSSGFAMGTCFADDGPGGIIKD